MGWYCYQRSAMWNPSLQSHYKFVLLATVLNEWQYIALFLPVQFHHLRLSTWKLITAIVPFKLDLHGSWKIDCWIARGCKGTIRLVIGKDKQTSLTGERQKYFLKKDCKAMKSELREKWPVCTKWTSSVFFSDIYSMLDYVKSDDKLTRTSR